PFAGESVLDTLMQVEKNDPVPPSRLQPKIPTDLETISLKCLEKDPKRRYTTAEELAEDLARFLKGEPIRARPITLWERAAKWAKRRPAVAALLATLALVIAGAVVGLAIWAGIAEHRRVVAERAQAAAEESEKKAKKSEEETKQANAKLEAAKE